MSMRPPAIELSISEDEMEHRRVQLEQNLQYTDLSLHLSSAPEDHSDVEYPRHYSDPHSFSGFVSFDHASREDLEQSHYQPWSYRTLEEDEGINPYAGETMSTAAHHASALTLSAGLGGRGIRRDISLSGAEYDPERPLPGIMANIGPKFSMLDANSTKSRQMVSDL